MNECDGRDPISLAIIYCLTKVTCVSSLCSFALRYSTTARQSRLLHRERRERGGGREKRERGREREEREGERRRRRNGGVERRGRGDIMASSKQVRGR